MKIKRPRQKYPMIELLWDDASNMTPGWMDNTEMHLQPEIVLSVGFLVKETNDHYVIASDTDKDGHHNGRTQIPKGMVRNLKVLRKADEEKKENVVAPNV